MNVNPLSSSRVFPPAPAAARPLPSAAPASARPTGATGAAGAAEPAFLELLTAEEREFFAQQSALGPLAYGRRASGGHAAPGPIGRRLDVRG
jgi:hypothetical protein